MKMLMLGLWLIVGGFVADGIAAGVFSPWWGVTIAVIGAIVNAKCKMRSDNPSVGSADSSLCPREPLAKE